MQYCCTLGGCHAVLVLVHRVSENCMAVFDITASVFYHPRYMEFSESHYDTCYTTRLAVDGHFLFPYGNSAVINMELVKHTRPSCGRLARESCRGYDNDCKWWFLLKIDTIHGNQTESAKNGFNYPKRAS